MENEKVTKHISSETIIELASIVLVISKKQFSCGI